MSLLDDGFNGKISSYQKSRLIPNLSASNKEMLCSSVLLAAFEIIPGFANELLSEIGVKLGTRSKISCATEVVFSGSEGDRPDGLILVENGKKVWSAIVEIKIQRSELTREQIEAYLDIARMNSVDAVITISNQFVLRPSHHPIKVPKTKLKKVDLYHFSWPAILSKSVLASAAKKVEDPEQARILGEVTHFIESVALCDLRMLSGWRDLCELVRQESRISKSSDEVLQATLSWQQLLRHCALAMSDKLKDSVSIYLTRARQLDPHENQKADCDQLVSENKLSAFFEVPNGASKIEMTADFRTKSLSFRMKLKAPDSRNIAKAQTAMNWLTRQLKDRPESENLRVRAYWPRRTLTTDQPFISVVENPASLIPEASKEIPTYLEIQSDIDLGANFKSVAKVAGLVEDALIDFYILHGQHLRAWIPKPIQLKEAQEAKSGEIADE